MLHYTTTSTATKAPTRSWIKSVLYVLRAVQSDQQSAGRVHRVLVLKRKGNNSIGIREERSQTRSLSCPHADLASLCCSSVPVAVPPVHPPLIHFAPAPSGCVKPASEPPSAMLKSLPVYLTAFLQATPADGPSPLWLMPPRRTVF